MPISQLTVLALYGEVHKLTLDLERAVQLLNSGIEYKTAGALQSVMLEVRDQLRVAAIQSEREAIRVVTSDAPEIGINPLTGEVA